MAIKTQANKDTDMNPLVKIFLQNGMMEMNIERIDPSFQLSELIHTAMKAQKMKAEYHFCKETGTLIFDKVLGRDENGDFYNNENGNLEHRKDAIKRVIGGVLFAAYERAIIDSNIARGKRLHIL